MASGMRAHPEALDVQALCLRESAERRGIATDVVMGSLYPVAARLYAWLRIPVGGRDFFFSRNVLLDGATRADPMLGTSVNGDAIAVSRDKARTKALLQEAGVSVPEGRTFDAAEADAALRYATSLGGPVCVKANAGSNGVMNFPGLGRPEAMAEAVATIAARQHRLLVERSVAGSDLRMFYARPRVGAVLIARPPTVLGDGRRDIAALIVAANEERARRAVPGIFPIQDDEVLAEALAGQGLSRASVPAEGRRVVLRHTANRAAGGEGVNPGDAIHPSYAQVAARACQALPGLLTGTVDMKALDPSVPAAPGNHWVLEINGYTGLAPFHHPWEGPPQDAGGLLLDLMAEIAAASAPARQQP